MSVVLGRAVLTTAQLQSEVRYGRWTHKLLLSLGSSFHSRCLFYAITLYALSMLSNFIGPWLERLLCS